MAAANSRRNVGMAVDFSACSKAALRWASENLVRGGDRVVVLHVNSCYQKEQGFFHLWEHSGSPLIPLDELCDPTLCQQYGVAPDPQTLAILRQMADHNKEIEVVAKIYYGDAKAKLCEAIDSVPLHCLVVGSRGLSKLKRALLGSVSSHVVSNAVCPVTVVKQ